MFSLSCIQNKKFNYALTNTGILNFANSYAPNSTDEKNKSPSNVVWKNGTAAVKHIANPLSVFG